MVTRNIIVTTLVVATILPKFMKATEPLILRFEGKPVEIVLRATNKDALELLPGHEDSTYADHETAQLAAFLPVSERNSAISAPATGASRLG
jgi:hypothetical protein